MEGPHDDASHREVSQLRVAPDTERRSFMKVLLAGAGSLCLPMSFAEAQAKQKVLRVVMTLSALRQAAGRAGRQLHGDHRPYPVR